MALYHSQMRHHVIIYIYNFHSQLEVMADVLNFEQDIDACLKDIDKQSRPRSNCFWRSSLIRVFPVCSSDKHFVNFVNIFLRTDREKCSICILDKYHYHTALLTVITTDHGSAVAQLVEH